VSDDRWLLIGTAIKFGHCSFLDRDHTLLYLSYLLYPKATSILSHPYHIGSLDMLSILSTSRKSNQWPSFETSSFLRLQPNIPLPFLYPSSLSSYVPMVIFIQNVSMYFPVSNAYNFLFFIDYYRNSSNKVQRLNIIEHFH